MNSWWSLTTPVDFQHQQIPLSGSNFTRNRIFDRQSRTCIAVSLDTWTRKPRAPTEGVDARTTASSQLTTADGWLGKGDGRASARTTAAAGSAG